jgi:hypothetical protein
LKTGSKSISKMDSGGYMENPKRVYHISTTLVVIITDTV